VIVGEPYDYRSAQAVICAHSPSLIDEIRTILTANSLELSKAVEKKQRNLSTQIGSWFDDSWTRERPSDAIQTMKYDLWKSGIPVEIEIGHQRLVFPDFFKFLADYSKGHIPASIMIVTNSPQMFGNDWHCSIQSTRLKIEAIREVYLVPTLVIPIDP
jgi:hypothetical protein